MPDSSSALPPKDPLEKKWKEVEKLEAKGLPESALKIVEEIQEEAKSKLLKAQIIKTVIYKAKYIHQLEEDGATESIIYFEKEYEEAPRPIKNVFASQLAELYNNYLDQFQWQIKQRTAIDQDTAQDIRQWSLERLVDRITELHLSAVSDPRLQKSNLKEYASILTEGNGETLRPSLFDLLAHRAIDFFSDTKTFLTEPINDFILDKEEYWLPSKKFSKLKITSQNNRSKKFHALKLFQSTVKYQLKSKNHEGLTDLEIKRFQFLREHASILNKDNLYIAALNKLYKDQRRKGGDIVLLAIARYHYQQGDLSQAYTICVQIQDEYKKGRSVEAAKALQANIEKKHFSLEGEQVYIPAEGMLFKASHRNITDLHYRLIKVDPETLEQFNRTKYKRKLDFLRKLEPEYTGMIALPEYDDYKSHTVEFGLEPLDIGRYLMVISDDAKFDNSKNTGTHFLEFQVSNLGIWSRRTFEGMTSIVITDRITGQPLEGVDAHFSVYDRESNSWNLSVTETSDQDGFIVPDLPKNVSHKAYFEHKNDIFYLDDNISVYENRYQDRTYNEVTFFTDRSIYRPGQTIHFKGLLAHFDQDHIPSIQKDQGVTIRLFDANGQEVADKKFTSNAFGTFHGYFTAPEGGLNGSMTLRADEGGYARIQVEEYKRPTFEVNFDTIAGTYQPGDEIRMSGTIMAYAGFGIDNAEIEVRVTKRQKYFFYPWWRRGWMPQAQSEKEILLESLTSDDDGKFEFTFATDPDLDDDDFIFYEYVTHIDATNQAGETRSGENILALSKKPFQLSTSIRKQENIDSLQYLNITAKNFSDQQVGVRGQVKITALISPTTTFVNKYWSKTDSILIDLDEYRDRFPHYAHGDEDQISNWTEAETILNQEFQSQEDPFAIDPKTWGPGYYKMEINASDEAGRSDQQTFYFEVFDLKDKIVPYNTTFWSFFDDRDYEPGESIQYNVGTAEENLMILFEVVKNQELMISKWVPIVDMDKMGFDIRDEDRGNIIAYIHYAKHNRSHNQQQLISVPWTNKALDIKLSTFRDKTKPGSEEEWTVSITPGSDSLKQVELLATMYDASLDAILPHSWYFRGYPYFNYANYGFYFSSWRGRGSQQLFMNWDSGSGVT
ncbi:MAG: hypothetical protein KJP00_12380, partial [Bacteroidia bacterium]|nr:hypothetical protein [Bacteroidia bacterium]